MKPSIRHQAVEILNQISVSDSFAGPLINDFLDNNSLSGTADGRLLTHLVYGVLRYRGHLDWILDRFYHGNFNKADEDVKNILRIGLYQLKFSDRLPDFAVVNEAVKTAKIIRPDKSGLVNAVLRNYIRATAKISFPSPENNPAQYLASFHSHPLWLVKKWLKIFGYQETTALCSANNELPPLTLRVNTLKISRDEMKKKLLDAAFEPQETSYSPDGIVVKAAVHPLQKTAFFEEGLLRIQDEGAQLVSHMIDPESTLSILDACAGTGGKATHLAAILKNKGRIVAVDQSTEKLNELQKDAKRLGFDIIETQALDLNKNLPASFLDKFDCVLLDAPCSGTGTLRRNPEIKWRLTEKNLRKLAAEQKTILQNTSTAVKKGGRLIYCTCSLLPEENENIIDNFLKNNPTFSIQPPPANLRGPFTDSRGFFYSYPHRHPMDGFFAAILIRQ
jgi:16S rRNA (cytosine967-C5)-methyltransferase